MFQPIFTHDIFRDNHCKTTGESTVDNESLFCCCACLKQLVNIVDVCKLKTSVIRNACVLSYHFRRVCGVQDPSSMCEAVESRESQEYEMLNLLPTD